MIVDKIEIWTLELTRAEVLALRCAIHDGLHMDKLGNTYYSEWDSNFLKQLANELEEAGD